MYFVLLGTKAQYIPFGPFEETRFDTGICTDNLKAMQASLLIFNIVLSSPHFVTDTNTQMQQTTSKDS